MALKVLISIIVLASAVVGEDCIQTADGTVCLGNAGEFAILAAAGITNVPQSEIFGDIGVSPIAATAVTGFALILDSTNAFSTSTQLALTYKVYAADYVGDGTPAMLTSAIGSMSAAYTNAAGRSTVPANINLLDGQFTSSRTFEKGVYKWKGDIKVADGIEITLEGKADDIFIFQVAGNIEMDGGAKMTLSGGPQWKNVFWQSAGFLIAGLDSELNGVFLIKTSVDMMKGSTLNGRILAQTQVALDAARVNSVVIEESTTPNSE